MNNKKIKQKLPSETQKFNFKGKLLKITMASGINFIVTSEHKMLISSAEGYKMKEASELKTSDYIVKSLEYPIPEIEPAISDLLDDAYLVDQEDIKDLVKDEFIRQYGSIRGTYRKLRLDRKAFLKNSGTAVPLSHIKKAGIYENIKNMLYGFKTEKGIKIKIFRLNSDLMYLIGLIASDGNNSKEKGTKRYTRIFFYNKNKDLIDVFKKIYKKIFPNFAITKKEKPDGIAQLAASNSFLATICANLGVKSPYKNSDILPILYLNKRLIAAFLRGYFDGDGTAYYKKGLNGVNSKICFYTISYLSAKRIHQMLLKLEISNKIFERKKGFVISIYDVAAKKRFISLAGSTHPRKREKFKQIKQIKSGELKDNLYIGFHYKMHLRENKSQLHKLGGNLYRLIDSGAPLTRGVYKKAAKIIKLPALDKFCIEKIKSVEPLSYNGKVYDMTIPEHHNFLIETGFVSSNCHQIGKYLGIGAHMAELRRTQVGMFKEDNLVTLHDLADSFWYWKNEGNEKYIRSCIKPIEFAVQHLPKIWVFDTTVDSLCHGIDLKIPGISKLESEIELGQAAAVMTLKDELIGVGTAKINSEQMLNEKKGIAVRMHTIFMKPGIYPKIMH